MKRIVGYIFSTLLLLNLVGCNESTSNERTRDGGINVSVTIPSVQSSGNDGQKQFKSFGIDVQSVLLQVIKSARTASDGSVIAEEVLSIEEMGKDSATGIWSVNLVLNPDDAPFDFKAMAYEGIVTVDTVTDNTPLFTGEALKSNTDTVIVLNETEESINDSVKKLPLLKSVDTVVNNDSSLALTFNLGYANGGVVEYELTSIADNGTGAECTTSLFQPATGNVDFALAVEASFNASLVEDPATCSNPQHFLKMTTTNNDTLKVPFILDVDSLTVNIALPPVIKSINVIDTETNFVLDVIVTDSDTLSLSYQWSVVEGTGILDAPTAQSTNLNGFDRSNGLEIFISVTNTITGAVSSLRYALIVSSTNPPITLAVLKAMIANDEDVTQVNTSEITDMSNLFKGKSSFNQDISSWDTSAVTNMFGLFNEAILFNQPLNGWDTSHVTNMESLFAEASSFNQPINEWDTSRVENMKSLFYKAELFNQPLNKWNVSNVTSMYTIFYKANLFNQPLNNWNTSNVQSMRSAFFGATSFNQPLNTWNISNVINMNKMFYNSSNFNQPLNNWDTSNVLDMYKMFYDAEIFNQPLNNWDTSNVTDMHKMFYNAVIFNQPLNNWDTSNVIDMYKMFYDAEMFNQNISNWDVLNVETDSSSFSENSPLEDVNKPSFKSK